MLPLPWSLLYPYHHHYPHFSCPVVLGITIISSRYYYIVLGITITISRYYHIGKGITTMSIFSTSGRVLMTIIFPFFLLFCVLFLFFFLFLLFLFFTYVFCTYFKKIFHVPNICFCVFDMYTSLSFWLLMFCGRGCFHHGLDLIFKSIRKNRVLCMSKEGDIKWKWTWHLDKEHEG